LSVQSARLDDRARIDALAVEAGMFAGTFSVGSATTLNCSWLFCKMLMIPELDGFNSEIRQK
jgi:hypothetical protein